MIDPAKINDLVAATERLLGDVDQLAPIDCDADAEMIVVDSSSAAQRQQELLLSAGIGLQQALDDLREAAGISGTAGSTLAVTA